MKMNRNHSKNMKKHLTSFQIIILGFGGVILLGTLLLMLPISTMEGIVTPFHEALFTSTSSVCVTGLVVQDTGSYWSVFGQSIILLLIQIGGMGVITAAMAITLISGRKMSLMQRSTMQEAIAAPQLGGIARLTGFILKTTLMIELIGTVLLLFVFCPEYGIKGIWLALFHSISAFCNAGFDILGTAENPYVSLMSYMDQPLLNGTIIGLIVIGGIGFLTWEDIKEHGTDLKKYRMQSKVILFTTVLLIFLPTMYFCCFEFQDMTLKERFWSSLFQAVTPRTAGFNTVDLNKISSAGAGLIIMLMLIGGSPGSTAGGMKTTTVAVLFANAFAVFSKKEDPQYFGRRIENSAVKNASTIMIMYIALFFTGGFLISIIEGFPLGVCLFETASAIGTVGLSLGITAQLSVASRMILIGLMFFGRVGGLTLIYAVVTGKNPKVSKLPKERITVG